MEPLADEYAPRGYRFVFVYTREAHPGEHYPHHTSFDQKLAHARVLRDHHRVRRPILVDDLEGTLHRAYGTLPNMTYVVSRAGRITFKSNWTDAETIRFALDYQLRTADLRREGARLAPFYAELQALRWNDPAKFQEGLAFAGPKAVAEFAEATKRWQQEGRRPGQT
jgi:hypothetical protein